MKIPEYISIAEVKRVCKELGIRDWTTLKTEKVSLKEAVAILKEVNTEKMKVPVEEFRKGLEVELEHGIRFRDANVTNNHPILTGRIVLAHLKEMMDYYERLEVAELEGDLLKATLAGDAAKIKKYFRRLAAARQDLVRAEAAQLK